ncbi:hypothetical protein A1QM_02790 [Vibrio genomosp. F10 str. 9ZC157]|nr:hypothetical protein A1QM_02790 [Vibrio genomosp. F10 str. 9ZC157]
MSLDLTGTNDGPIATDDSYNVPNETLLFTESFEGMTSTSRWTVVQGDQLGEWKATHGLEVQHDGLIAKATDGDYLAELDAHQNTSISTTIDTSGQDSLRVEFDYNPRHNGGNTSSNMTFSVAGVTITVNADGTLTDHDGLDVQISEVDSNGWYRITGQFDVASDDTVISFAGSGASDSLGALLDNISVTGIQQPDLTTEEDQPITISFAELLGNDSDVDGDTLQVTNVTNAANGQFVVDYQNKTITFTPDRDYNGEATFEYTISDGNGGTDTATVTLNVTPVNDAPVATDDVHAVGENLITNGSFEDFTSDKSTGWGDRSSTLDGWDYSANSGKLDVVNDGYNRVTTDGERYIDMEGEGGRGDNVTLSQNVNGVKSGESYQLSVDVAARSDNHTAKVQVVWNGQVIATITPDTNVMETHTFEVIGIEGDNTVSFVEVGREGDNSGTYLDNVKLQEILVDLTTDEDTILEIPHQQLLGNDYDVDGDELTITDVKMTNDIEGSVSIVDGKVVFEPAQDFNGITTFEYTISDGNGGTDTALVTVNVKPVNDAPVFEKDGEPLGDDENISVVTKEDVPVSGSVVATDVDGDDLAYTILTQAENGTVTIDKEGNWVYTPNEEYDGVDKFDVQVSDGQGGFDTVTIDVTVLAVAEMTVEADDLPVQEANNAYLSFTIKLDEPVSESVTLGLTLGGANDTADIGSDYLDGIFVSDGEGGYRPITDADLTLMPGTTELQVFVQVKDDAETEEKESVTLFATSGSEFVKTPSAEGTGIIEDDRGVGNPNVDEDTTATFQIKGGNTVEEGDYVFLGFNVVLGNVVGENVAFTLSAAIDGDSTTADASAGIDYADEVFYVSDGNGGFKEAEPSDLIVKAGETSTQVFVKVLDDDSYESNEVVGLTASTTSELVVGNTVSTATGVITDATDNPPEAEDFTAQVESSGRTFVQFDTGTGSIEGEGTDHISDTEDDADSQANVQVVITELPDHGTLWYNNIQITKADLYSGEGDTEYTQFDPNLIQYEPNADSEGFVLGVKDAQLGEQEANRTEFLNWGEATDKANERLLTLENGDKVTISSSNGPLVQYLGDPNADHVGYGIGAKNDGGIQSNETISITFDDRPADSVTLGLDGLGGWFDENLNTKDESSVQITVFYTIDDVESSETFSYQKSTAGDTNLFHEITIPSDGFTLPEGAEITKVDLGTDGNGNWELRYIETEATDTFDYRAVDSDGNFSDESTVTIGTPSSAPIATNDPVEFSVSLGSFNNDGSWSTDDGSLGEGAAISARYQTEDRDITDSGIKRGVSGHENGGIASQIQFNREDGESEQFIINLDKPVTEFSFTTSNLYKGEGGSDNHEQGKWVAYLDGVAVASDTFVANEGSNKGTYSYDAGDLEGVAFDSIVFESIDFVNTPARGDDSSDYFLTGFKASSEGAYAVNQGGILEIPASELLNNDTDPEGDSLRITYVYGETEGEARIENGVVYFDLDDDFVGTTTFEYQITDDNGGYDSATVNVIVNPAPIPAVVDSVSLLSESVPEGTDMAFKVNLDSGVLVETRLDIEFGLGTDTANDSDVDLLDLVFTNGVTYDANSNEIVIPVGVKDFTVLIPTQKDGVHELDETYSLRIGGEDGASATGTIENMDIPTLSVVSQGDVSEGSAATFQVNLSVPSDQSTELTLSTSVDGEENTAEADDLNGTITAYYLDGNDVKVPLLVEGGKTTVPPFVTAVFVEVGTQQDSLYEGPEQFELLVSGKTGDTDIATAKGSTNIVDDGSVDPGGDQPADDDRPTVESVSDVRIEEGKAGTFTVELSNQSDTDTVVSLRFGNASATSPEDFDTSSVTIKYGDTEKTIDVINGRFQLEIPGDVQSFDVVVNTVNDDFSDDNEQFLLFAKTLTQSDSIAGTATIFDNEKPTIDLDGSEYKLEFVSENAGYNNVFGYYVYDELSQTQELHVLIDNANDVNDPNLGTLTSLDNVDYFLIPNGANIVSGVNKLEINAEGKLIVDGELKTTHVFTGREEDSQLRTSLDDDGNVVLSFDDQRQEREDNDFDDLVIKVTEVAGSTGYETTFTEDGPAVSIADTKADIFDDKDNVQSMKVVLSNGKDGDDLTWIQAQGFSVEKAVANGIITLLIVSDTLGGVSAQEFESFLGNVQFTNSSDTPDETPRQINITVTDGAGLESESATSIVNITPVDELLVSNSYGVEDQRIALNIELNDDETSVTHVKISDIPEGAVVFVGDDPVDITASSVTVSVSDLEQLSIKAPQHSDVNFNLTVIGQDENGIAIEEPTSLTVDVHPDADQPNLTIGEFVKVAAIDFEDVQIKSGTWDSDIEINKVEGAGTIGKWLTSNEGQHVEVGTEGTYLPGNSTNQVMEIEGENGDKVLYTDMDLVAGRFYKFEFDIAAREGNPASSDMSVKLLQLDENGDIVPNSTIELYDFDPTAEGWENGQSFNLPIESSGKYRLLLIADEADSTGAILDNITFKAVDNYGYEDTYIKLSEINASLVDELDKSESLKVELMGMPVGAMLIDGEGNDARTYTVTEENKDDLLDVTDWDLSELQIKVEDPGKFSIKVIATSTEIDTNRNDAIHDNDPQAIGGRLTAESIDYINVEVLEKVEGGDSGNGDIGLPTANDFSISFEHSVAEVNFEPHATDVEDDADAGKVTRVELADMPLHGKLYYQTGVDTCTEINKGDVIADTSKVFYVADRGSEVTTSIDSSNGALVGEGIDTLTVNDMSISGGTIVDGKFINDGQIKFDGNPSQGGYYVDSDLDKGNGQGKETQIGEYIAIVSEQGNISSLSVTLDSLNGHLGNPDKAVVKAHLFDNGQLVGTQTLSLTAIDNHSGRATISSNDTTFDEVRLVGTALTNNAQAGFNLSSVDMVVNGAVDINDTFTYWAIDTDNNKSDEKGIVSVEASTALPGVEIIGGPGLDHVSVLLKGNWEIGSDGKYVMLDRTISWATSAAKLFETESHDILDYDPINGAVIDVGIACDTVTMGSGSDTIYLGEGHAPGETVDPNAHDQALKDFASRSMDQLFDTTGDENSGLKGINGASNAGLDIAQAGGGNDRVYGEQGQDIIFGGTGHDILDGGEGNDAVRGGSGNDTIFGGAGDDIILGDHGSDILIGNDGFDVFKWNELDNSMTHEDHIVDFNRAEDRIDLSELVDIEGGESMDELLQDISVTGSDITLTMDSGDDGQSQIIVLENAASQFSSKELSDVSSLLNDLMSLKTID